MPALIWLIQLLGTSLTLSKYVYIEEKKDWYGVYSHCRTEYTDLAPISSQLDIRLLKELAGNYSDYIWFGLLRDDNSASNFRWSGGGEVKMFVWDDNQPNPELNERYGAMINYRWHDAPPDVSFHFFCYNVYVVREEKTWEEALKYCRKHHKDLASISSDTEMMLIQRELNSSVSTEHVWLGLHFLAGEWLWMDGNAAGFEAWGQGGKPECPRERMSCGAVVSNGIVWEAHDCVEKLHFICY